MEKLVLAVIACAMALPGCSSENDCTTVSPQPEENVTEIKLNAGILGVATRAPVLMDDSITASSVVSTTDGNYAANVWSSTVTFVASPIPTSILSFSSAHYYPVNSSTIYVKGYYPAGTLTGRSVTLAADGAKDVMIAAQASGMETTATPLSFISNHLLTQLQFKLISSMGHPASGTNMISLVIKQQKASATLDLNTTAMTYTTRDLTPSGTLPITATRTVVSGYPTVKSGEAPSVAIITSDGVTYLETAISITAETGKPHLITLTFVPKETTTAISITVWQVGGQGSSSLQ